MSSALTLLASNTGNVVNDFESKFGPDAQFSVLKQPPLRVSGAFALMANATGETAVNALQLLVVLIPTLVKMTLSGMRLNTLAQKVPDDMGSGTVGILAQKVAALSLILLVGGALTLVKPTWTVRLFDWSGLKRHADLSTWEYLTKSMQTAAHQVLNHFKSNPGHLVALVTSLGLGALGFAYLKANSGLSDDIDWDPTLPPKEPSWYDVINEHGGVCWLQQYPGFSPAEVPAEPSPTPTAREAQVPITSSPTSPPVTPWPTPSLETLSDQDFDDVVITHTVTNKEYRPSENVKSTLKVINAWEYWFKALYEYRFKTHSIKEIGLACATGFMLGSHVAQLTESRLNAELVNLGVTTQTSWDRLRIGFRITGGLALEGLVSLKNRMIRPLTKAN